MPDLIKAHSAIVEQNAYIKADTRSWTPIADQDSLGHFSATRRSRSVSLSRNLAVSSLLYGRLMDAFVDFVVPKDMYLAIPKDFPAEYKPHLNWIWNTGPSALASSARDLVQSLFIEGELLLTPRINDADGRLTLTNQNPDSIEEISRGEGLHVVSKIKLDTSGVKGDGENKDFEVIRPDATGTLSGDIFYFRVLPAGYTAGIRGLPLLIRGLDDIASATELIYNRITRLGRFATHYWDVTMTGATQETIDDFLASEHSIPPESGEVFAHNESVDWDIVTEQSSSLSTDAEYFINLVIGGTGLTPEFIGHALSRDITTESLFSAFMRLENLQSSARHMIETILQFALTNAKVAGKTKLDNPAVSAVISKEVGSRLAQRQSSALRNFVTSMKEAIDAGLMENEDARDALNSLLLRYSLRSDNPNYVPFSKSDQGITQARIV
ncbi:MAG: hypothetical protein H8D23_28420 [Candidatus Brocadiales bacterium]|nr:hypothetical protein [Candidatus Brocadiales bacterium]